MAEGGSADHNSRQYVQSKYVPLQPGMDVKERRALRRALHREKLDFGHCNIMSILDAFIELDLFSFENENIFQVPPCHSAWTVPFENEEYQRITSNEITDCKATRLLLEWLFGYRSPHYTVNVYSVLLVQLNKCGRPDLCDKLEGLKEASGDESDELSDVAEAAEADSVEKLLKTALLARCKAHCLKSSEVEFVPLQGDPSPALLGNVGRRTMKRLVTVTRPIQLLYKDLGRQMGCQGDTCGVSAAKMKKEKRPLRKVALVSGAGAGKTTLCKLILNDFHDEEPGGCGHTLSSHFDFAIYIRCREVTCKESLLEFLAPGQGPEAIRHLTKHSSRVLLVVDGIDEIGDSRSLPDLTKLISESGRLPNATVIITSRPCDPVDHLTRDEDSWTRYELAGFSEEQFKTFCGAGQRTVTEDLLVTGPETGSTEASGCFAEVSKNKALKETVMSSPLLAKFVRELFVQGGQLPESKILLYGAMLQKLAGKDPSFGPACRIVTEALGTENPLPGLCLESVRKNSVILTVHNGQDLSQWRTLEFVKKLGNEGEDHYRATLPHPTWVEFLAAYAIADSQSPDLKLKDYVRVKENAKLSYPFWYFLCGLIDPTNLPGVLPFIEGQMDGFDGKRHLLFLMACILENRRSSTDGSDEKYVMCSMAGESYLQREEWNLDSYPLVKSDLEALHSALHLHQHVTVLSLSGTMLSADHIEFICSSEALRQIHNTLDLSRNNLHGQPIKGLSRVLGNSAKAAETSGLKELRMSKCSLEASDMGSVARIMTLPALEVLDIENQEIGTEGIASLAKKMTKCPAMTHLKLGGCALKAGSGEWLKEVVQLLPELKEIFLSTSHPYTNCLRAADLASLLDAFQRHALNGKIEMIHVRYNEITDDCEDCVANFFRQLPGDRVCFLCLEGNKITPTCLSSIYGKMGDGDLTDGDLADGDLADQRAIRISGQWIWHGRLVQGEEFASLCVERFSNRRSAGHADQSRLGHDDDILSKLNPEFGSRKDKLASIDFSWNNIYSGGISGFATSFLCGNRRLKVLSLGHNKIGLDGLANILEAVCDGGGLQYLDMRANPLFSSKDEFQKDLDAVESLLPKCNSLCHLGLSSTSMSDEVGQHFAGVLSSATKIVTLDLSSNQLGDGAMKAIVDAVSDNLHLKQLSLAGNSISDKGIHSLRNAVRRGECECLQAVWIGHNPFESLDLPFPLLNTDGEFDAMQCRTGLTLAH